MLEPNVFPGICRAIRDEDYFLWEATRDEQFNQAMGLRIWKTAVRPPDTTTCLKRRFTQSFTVS